jgi:hypothetical protein
VWAYFLPCLPVSERNLGQGIDDSYAPPFCEECLFGIDRAAVQVYLL